ncbi:MAG TPA: type VI secretion system membrane subunit TssM, partial [Pyrinomonadaceae bacterium]|nr:type VI secretion system membrane subunit TssM [Pyrinomonadaceae bacterium]
MSWHSNQLSYALGIGGMVSLYGIMSLGIYYLGPMLGLGTVSVIIIIALLLLTWPIVILFLYFRRKRAARREAAAATAEAGEEAPQAQAKPKTKGAAAANVRASEDVTRDAEEAVQWLRSSRLGDSNASDAVYGLPWYLVAGPPASGKTSLLLTSGLSFQALPSQRSAEQNIVRPTQHCEWRVTDSAVMLDTTGRYQTEGPQRDEWAGLVETIKKHRKDRPFDGLLVIADAEKILRSSEAEVEQQAKVMRARLDDLMQRARARFPVYLVFSHADVIEGFREFFTSKSGDGRSQVWGTTIPLNKSQNAHALFDVEFDLLYDSLMKKRLRRLGVQAPAAEQLRVFNFPHNFGEARSRLGLFTSFLFRPNPFSESPLLRGFYFTANVAGAPARAASVEDDGDVDERGAHAVGRGYFTEKFFREVILQDKDLAASFQAFQKRPPRLRNILLIAGAILLTIFLALSLVSFFGNRKLIADATDRGTRVDEITRADVGHDPLKKEPAAARVEVEAVDALRQKLIELDETPPIYLRFGLYSGNDIAPRLRDIYFDSIEQRFKKPTVAAIERDLRNFAAGTPTATIPTPSTTATNASASGQSASQEDILGRHYDLLKAYLMLSDATRVEPTFLASTIGDYWKKSSPPDMEIVSLQQLDFFARQLTRDEAPHIKVDDQLVSNVRRKLQAYPPINRFYKRITTEINAKASPVTIDSILQGTGRGALVGTYTVPGSYTIEGYRNYMKAAIETAAQEISKEDWVMGAAASNAQTQATDISKLESMYLRDYTDQWRKFLTSISVQQFKSRDDAIEALKVLSSTDSPMERVMTEVARNTNLSAKPEAKGWWGWIKSWFTSSSTTDTGGGTEVEKEFAPLFRFVASDSKQNSSPMSQYRAELRRVLEQLQ